MLGALRELDQSTTATALLVAAEELLPNPSDRIARHSTERQLAHTIIKEIEGKAKRPDPIAVQEALAREISGHVLSRVDVAGLKARIGEKGFLSPLSYRVLFTPRFENGARLWGISKSHVTQAITRCDRAQHFAEKMEKPDAAPRNSLFTFTPPVQTDDTYTIIVYCRRTGDVLLTEEAYRIYHHEVDLVSSPTPLEILVRFLKKFGLDTDLRIFNSDGTTFLEERKRLFHDVIYNIPEGGHLTHYYADGQVRIDRPIVSNGDVEISLAFTVDARAYQAQLARHGVKVQLPKRPMHSVAVHTVPIAAGAP
jgi:hypothetical protein